MSKECKRSVNSCKMSFFYLLFTFYMRQNITYTLLLSLVFIALNSCETEVMDEQDISQRVKVVLRDTGHQLLLDHKDSTSLVLPVTKVNDDTYQLRFEKSLTFKPEELVKKIKENINKLNLPQDYRVEVINCVNKEVAYSYEFRLDQKKTIISCAGRYFPEQCYLIELTFINLPVSTSSSYWLYLLPVILLLAIAAPLFLRRNRKKADVELQEEPLIEEVAITDFLSIGDFQFYPEQNKLIKTAIEIPLSRKECELLEIFVSQKNQIIKREDLMKQVWEDKGVVVGRSLDTYISKLRKKLKEDKSINIKNIHGVGYKLEVI